MQDALTDIEDVATDQQNGGNAVMMNIDRVTASRMGIAPSTVDNTLYDAYGQRQINTLYTQLNQYHVIMEAMPSFQTDPSKLQSLYIQSNAASAGTSGAGASTSFASSGSTSAGSSAATAVRAKYTPASAVLARPRARHSLPRNPAPGQIQPRSNCLPPRVRAPPSAAACR